MCGRAFFNTSGAVEEQWGQACKAGDRRCACAAVILAGLADTGRTKLTIRTLSYT